MAAYVNCDASAVVHREIYNVVYFKCTDPAYISSIIIVQSIQYIPYNKLFAQCKRVQTILDFQFICHLHSGTKCRLFTW